MVSLNIIIGIISVGLLISRIRTFSYYLCMLLASFYLYSLNSFKECVIVLLLFALTESQLTLRKAHQSTRSKLNKNLLYLIVGLFISLVSLIFIGSEYVLELGLKPDTLIENKRVWSPGIVILTVIFLLMNISKRRIK